MAAKIHRRSGARLSEINVTPMVDVMLVLLIIFMATAPLLEQSQSQVNVDLPDVAAAPSSVAEDAIIITMDVNSRLFINDRRVSFKDLRGKLTALFKGRARKEIFLRADRAVPYGEVVKTMAIIRQSGITRLNMVTNPLGRTRKTGKKGSRRRPRR